MSFQEDIPLSQRRGIETYDLNQEMIFWDCSEPLIIHDTLSRELSLSLIRDLTDLNSIVFSDHKKLLVVYNLRGHLWTVATTIGVSLEDSGIYEVSYDISRSLQSDVIAFCQSDTGSYIRYECVKAGSLVETFDFCVEVIDDSRNEFQVEPYILEFTYSDDPYEDFEVEGLSSAINCRFCSTSRRLAEPNIEDPYEFVSGFLAEKNVYVPYVPWIDKNSMMMLDSRLSRERINLDKFNHISLFNFNSSMDS